MKPVRVAVVGLGYWGPNLVRVLYELPETAVSWACDLDQSKLKAMKRRYPAIRRTTQLSRVFGDETVDAVAFATPVSTHFDLASAALEAGKHVFVEKPLAASTAEAAELVTLAKKRGLVLMPGHTFLYSPPVNLIADLMGSGDLGSIYFISMSRVNLGIHQSDVSVTWDLGPHDFSILRYWLGETPVRVSAISRGCVFPETPDVAFINLQFHSDTLAHVELSWLAPSKLRRTAIVGSEKMVLYDDTSTEPVRIFDSGVMLPEPQTYGEYRLTYRTGDILSPRVEVSEPLTLQMRDFARAIRTGQTPRSSAELGVDVVRTIEAVDQSLAAAGAVIDVDGVPRRQALPAAGEAVSSSS
ncbi:MAG: Gfo/Idh/MocA family oxidoreductase [Actinomycetota bacterium]|nr:Gfo/Idh/MocA family oxidoreductase [Actinomycetota bacterium]